jgi:transcriptional regulator with XRE-family HTH domain
VATSVESVGQRIKKLRLAEGWSQRELARRMVALGDQKASGVYVKNVEDGLYKPGSERLIYFARVFRTTTDYLLSGEREASEDRFPATQLQEEGLPANEIARLGELWEQFPDKRVGLLESAHELARAYAKLHTLTTPSNEARRDTQPVQ